MRKVTLGQVIQLDKAVTIPDEWVDLVNPLQHKYALLLTTNPAIVRFIPTKHTKVVKYHIQLSQIEEDFLEKVVSSLQELEVQTLFNSGVCFVETDCYYEFFIDYPDEEEKVQQVVELLERAPGVLGVDSTIIEINEG